MNRLSKLIAIFFSVLFSIQRVYAQDNLLTDEPPGPSALLIPVIRILNILVISSGALFALMIIITSYKFVMSQGDPKGMHGARQSLTYTILGGFVIVFIYVIQHLLVQSFGLLPALGNPDGVFASLKIGLCGILDIAGVIDTGCN